MTKDFKEVPIEDLRRVCDPSIFHFSSTAELPILTDMIGQERAMRATSFGIDMASPGYHIFALGPAGTGKATMIKGVLERKSAQQPVPDDWCYVNNFEDSDCPHALRLPAGKGGKFQRDMDKFVEDLSHEIPRAFASQNYEQEHEKIEAKFQDKRQTLFKEIEKATASKDFALLQTPRGFVLAPVINGNVFSPEQFGQLNDQEREKIEQRQGEIQEELRDTLHQLQEIQEEVNEAVRQLDQEVVGYAVSHMNNRIMRKYTELDTVMQFLQNVRNDLLKNVDTYKKAKDMEEAQERLPFLAPANGNKPDFDHYRVNLLVANSRTHGAPVIFESNPTYLNLLGRVEYQARLGALVTNFQMIKSGTLHRANGGYLIVNARDILTKPLAWEGLKRALKDQEIRIESMYENLGAISTRSLDPEPIPLDIKVIVTGDPMVYYMLYNLDQDLSELFKVRADFATQMDWTEKALQEYARFIGTVCQEGKLLPFAPSGVAKVVEQSSRMVSHQKKLATTFRNVVDLIHQSSYWAGKQGSQYVQAEDVRKAISEQIYRANQLEEHLQEMIQEGTILIDTAGEAVGQVNGISVLIMGDYSFGKPSRITARTSAGRAGVINIERETALGGRIHNKGVLILSGYLGGRYAQEILLTFSTSITFEQSYEEVEGDSASSTELYALLSSLSGYPIRQDLAVIGAVNQHGRVQAIGGVNEKIEGFFDVCSLNGLTGRQGVLIPQSNVKHRMLREDVVEAVATGKFHVYPIITLDEGIELLTGVEAGIGNTEGDYPENTVNYAVQKRLRDLAEKVQAFSQDSNHAEPTREKVLAYDHDKTP